MIHPSVRSCVHTSLLARLLLLSECKYIPGATQCLNTLQVQSVKGLNCIPTPFLQCRFSKKPLMVIHHLEECPYSQGEQSKPFQTTWEIQICLCSFLKKHLSTWCEAFPAHAGKGRDSKSTGDPWEELGNKICKVFLSSNMLWVKTSLATKQAGRHWAFLLYPLSHPWSPVSSPSWLLPTPVLGCSKHRNHQLMWLKLGEVASPQKEALKVDHIKPARLGIMLPPLHCFILWLWIKGRVRH